MTLFFSKQCRWNGFFYGLVKSPVSTYIPDICQSRFRWFRDTGCCLFGNSDYWHDFWVIQTPNVMSIWHPFGVLYSFEKYASWGILGFNACGGTEAIFCCHEELNFFERYTSCVHVIQLLFLVTDLIWLVCFSEDPQRGNIVKTMSSSYQQPHIQ